MIPWKDFSVFWITDKVEDPKEGKKRNKIHVRINRSLCYLALRPIPRSMFLFSVLHVKKLRANNLQSVTRVTSCGKRVRIILRVHIFFHTGIERYSYKRKLLLKRRDGMANPYEKFKKGGVADLVICQAIPLGGHR